MLSKFLRVAPKIRAWIPSTLFINKPRVLLQNTPKVKYSDLIPPTQYDTPFPKKLNIGYALRVYWETIPLFITTCVSISILFIAIGWACFNKVDAVFSAYSRNNISRTMDLRNPTFHKMVRINQQTVPWPEMQDVLDKMKAAEKRIQIRAETCAAS